MAKIAVLCSNHSLLGNTGHRTGVSLYEVSRVAYELEKANYRFDFVSPNGGEIPIDPNTVDFSDAISRDYYERKTFLEKLQSSLPLEALSKGSYAAVVVCGGWGCVDEYLNNQRISAALLETSFQNLVFIGYGAYLLLQPALTEKFSGSRITVPSLQEEDDIGFQNFWPQKPLWQSLKEAGFETVFSAPWTRHILDAGILLSAQNVFSAQAVSELLVNKLKTEGL